MSQLQFDCPIGYTIPNQDLSVEGFTTTGVVRKSYDANGKNPHYLAELGKGKVYEWVRLPIEWVNTMCTRRYLDPKDR